MSPTSRTGDFFATLPSRINPLLARTINAVIRFEVQSEDGGTWTVQIANRTCMVTRESEQRATLVLGLREEVLFAIAKGDLAPMQAYTDGRVTVKGDMGLAMQLLDLFNVGAASVPYLIPLLQSEDVETRVYGLEALGKSGGRNVIPAVKRLLDDPDERVCEAAKRSLEAVSARTPQKPSTPDSNLALGTVRLTGQSPGGTG